MRKFLLLVISLMFIASSTNYLQSQTFVGSDACKMCHSSKYDTWIDSGHPYKFTIITDGQPPVYPPEAVNFQAQWMDSLGDGSHDWTQIAGVIGGYGWKARFVGLDGHLVGTAGAVSSDGVGHNQFNFYEGVDHGWVDYHPSDVKIYNYGCFKCHTTGGDTTGTWLATAPGLGTFTEGGVGCEGCHGPGSEHIAGPTSDNIDRVYEFAHQDNAIGGLMIGDDIMLPDPDKDRVNFLCGTCHNRDYKSPINSSGGFIKHHEQWDEFVTTDHYDAGFTCNTCHEPHTRVIWDGEGITKECGLCHSEQVEVVNHSVGANCIDCHMPYAAKSGTKRGESGYVGDVRSHLFSITVDAESMFTEDGAWVKDDDEREASLSPAYSCLGCHNNDPNDNIPDKTLEQAVAQSMDMHEATIISQQKEIVAEIFPNPSAGATKISFNLVRSEAVSFEVFSSSGQLVYSMKDVSKPAGAQVIHWDGNSNTGASINTGYYLVKISTASLVTVKKLVMSK